MKNSLVLSSLITLLATPASLFAESAGLSLPSSVGPLPVFAGFVVTLTLLTVLADYGRRPRTLVARSMVRAADVAALPAKSAHALAA